MLLIVALLVCEELTFCPTDIKLEKTKTKSNFLYFAPPACVKGRVITEFSRGVHRK